MLSLLEEEGDTHAAKKLIKELVTHQPSSVLYTKLADICNKEKDSTHALQYYMQAIQLVSAAVGRILTCARFNLVVFPVHAAWTRTIEPH